MTRSRFKTGSGQVWLRITPQKYLFQSYGFFRANFLAAEAGNTFVGVHPGQIAVH
jgi:hypothetical protein